MLLRRRSPFLLAAVCLLMLLAEEVDAQEPDDNSTEVPLMSCTVCRDRSRITNPERVLDIPGFGTLNCAVIDGLVGGLYTVDNPNCQLLQSVSTICGCPALYDDPTDDSQAPCQLCGDGQVPVIKQELPLSYLDDVVSYEGVTCQLLEAYFESSLESADPTCELGKAWTQDYCCTVDEWMPPSNPCQVCVENPDASIDLGQELTCSQLQEAASTLWDESHPSCGQIKTITSVPCGCHETQHGEVAETCTVCKDGSSVTTPDRVVPFMADQFFGIEPTCQQIQDATNLLALGAAQCNDAQLIGSYCGCPAVENPCAFCAPGDNITTPTRRHASSFERFGESITCEQLESVLLQYSADSVECFLGQETNWECGCNDGFYGYLGTESIRDQKILIYMTRSAGILSICGSIFILQDFIRGMKGRRNNVYRQIMVLMACFDFTTAMAWVIGSLSVPPTDVDGNDANIFGASGNDALCTAQGFFIMLGYGSLFFNISLSVYYLLVVVYSWKEHQLQKARIWLLCLPAFAACSLAFGALPFYEHDWIACFLRPKPYADHSAATGFTIGPIAVTAMVATYCQIRVYLSVRKTVRKGLRWSMSHRLKKGEQGQAQYTFNPNGNSAEVSTEEPPRKKCCQDSILFQNNAESAVFWQSAFYLFVFYLCWPILAFAVENAENQNFGFWVAAGTIGSLQGFFNCLIYIRPRFLRWRRTRRKAKKQKQKKLALALANKQSDVTGCTISEPFPKRFTDEENETSQQKNSGGLQQKDTINEAPKTEPKKQEKIRFNVPENSGWDLSMRESDASVSKSENFAMVFPSLE